MISMIFAMDPNKLIGKGNDLPWHYPEDLAYFRKMTENHTVVMGLETFRSILARNGKPLANRQSVVASLEPYQYPGVLVVNDLETYLRAKHDEEIFVIGGKTIYEVALPYADRLYITHIRRAHEGNVYLSKLDLGSFHLVKKDERKDLAFAVYERNV